MKNSSGNILFMVLIAVALFAVLSYVVVQNSRGTTTNTTKETARINASVLAQYSASLKSGVHRMLNNEDDVLKLQFNTPDEFDDLTRAELGVFYPTGGGVYYEIAPAGVIDASASNPTGQWVYSLNFEIKGIGTSKASSLDGNDLIAFMVGIRKEVCEQVNKRLSIPLDPMPHVNNTAYSSDLIDNINKYNMDHDYVLPTAENVIGAGPGDALLAGESEGCYYDEAGKNYVYYSVVSAR